MNTEIDPDKTTHEITMETVPSVIHRRGHKRENLPVEDLQLAKSEVKAALKHNLNERDYMEFPLYTPEIIQEHLICS